MTAPRIAFRNVTKRFGGTGRGAGGVHVTAVENVSLEVADGEVVSLIGPSGCGKSTLLGMGAGLFLPTDGAIYVDGERVTAPNDHVAFMLQKDLLLPWRTIRANVEFGLEIKGVPAVERRERSLALLRKFRLGSFAEHYPHQLSGGMRQRAAIARTLVVDPTVLLMDEPFSAIDAQTKMVLHQDLARTLAEERKTALFITHDLAETIALSDRILVMSARPGTIISSIVVDLPSRDDPMSRRCHPKVGDYINQLMEMLHVGEDGAAASIH